MSVQFFVNISFKTEQKFLTTQHCCSEVFTVNVAAHCAAVKFSCTAKNVERVSPQCVFEREIIGHDKKLLSVVYVIMHPVSPILKKLK